MSSRRIALWLMALAVADGSAPTVWARCGMPIAVGRVSAAGAALSATLTNSTTEAFKGYLGVAVALADGSTALASIPVAIPPGGSTTAGASFPVEIEQIVDTETCDNPPWGITESPDPVIIVLPPLEDEEEEGGGTS